ncbi:atherin-like, partial [Harpia harpyja]|uniref:atherin-like n=1 Tax=Harpia harpyja TaxID=202280 RepID=UPI0022B0ADB5
MPPTKPNTPGKAPATVPARAVVGGKAMYRAAPPLAAPPRTGARQLDMADWLMPVLSRVAVWKEPEAKKVQEGAARPVHPVLGVEPTASASLAAGGSGPPRDPPPPVAASPPPPAPRSRTRRSSSTESDMARGRGLRREGRGCGGR